MPLQLSAGCDALVFCCSLRTCTASPSPPTQLPYYDGAQLPHSILLDAMRFSRCSLRTCTASASPSCPTTMLRDSCCTLIHLQPRVYSLFCFAAGHTLHHPAAGLLALFMCRRLLAGRGREPAGLHLQENAACNPNWSVKLLPPVFPLLMCRRLLAGRSREPAGLHHQRGQPGRQGRRAGGQGQQQPQVRDAVAGGQRLGSLQKKAMVHGATWPCDVHVDCVCLPSPDVAGKLAPPLQPAARGQSGSPMLNMSALQPLDVRLPARLPHLQQAAERQAGRARQRQPH